MTATLGSVEDLLAAARSGLVRHDPVQARAAVAAGELMVDIRPAWQRAREGEIAGSVIVERNHLEWRLHPASGSRLRWAVAGQRWIVVCSEGYTSSLAAAALVSLGIPAADLDGGVRAWQAAGLPLVAGPTRVEGVAGRDRLMDLGDFHLGDLRGRHVEDVAAH